MGVVEFRGWPWTGPRRKVSGWTKNPASSEPTWSLQGEPREPTAVMSVSGPSPWKGASKQRFMAAAHCSALGRREGREVGKRRERKEGFDLSADGFQSVSHEELWAMAAAIVSPPLRQRNWNYIFPVCHWWRPSPGKVASPRGQLSGGGAAVCSQREAQCYWRAGAPLHAGRLPRQRQHPRPWGMSFSFHPVLRISEKGNDIIFI